jgi:hypothetical protein
MCMHSGNGKYTVCINLVQESHDNIQLGRLGITKRIILKCIKCEQDSTSSGRINFRDIMNTTGDFECNTRRNIS